jgi:hypothetical protein
MSDRNDGHDDRTQTLYSEQGMGLRIPPGERPAVLIVDMQNDFCDPEPTAPRRDSGASSSGFTPRCAFKSREVAAPR